jgi:hypothetical protein
VNPRIASYCRAFAFGLVFGAAVLVPGPHSAPLFIALFFLVLPAVYTRCE